MTKLPTVPTRTVHTSTSWLGCPKYHHSEKTGKVENSDTACS